MINRKTNADDVFIRNLYAALLLFLYNKIRYTQRVSQDEEREVTVPFFPVLGGAGSERFLQDWFVSVTDCPPEMAELNYERIPRGVVNYPQLTVDSAQQTNPMTRGEYLKVMPDGQTLLHSAMIKLLPMKGTLDIEMHFDNKIDADKIWEQVISTFYRVHTIDFRWKEMRLAAWVCFPDEMQVDIPVQVKEGEKHDQMKMTVSLEVQTIFPVIDATTEMRGDRRIMPGKFDINPGPRSPS